MTSTVPSKLVYPPTNSYHPWINRSFLNHVKKRNSIFSSAKRSGSPSLWGKYCSYRNKTLAYFRHLKSKFFQNLLTSPSPRSFWSAVKCVCSKPVSIPSLFHNGSPVTSPFSKADVLNQYFSSCFNMSTASLPPLAHNRSTSLHDNSPDFLCNPDDICSFISCIPMDTASGLDGISSIMLHNTAPSISLSLSIIFNSSLSTGIFPSDWKTPILYLFPNRKPLLYSLQTITQSLYFPSQARSWNVTYLTICINFVLLTTSSLTVSLVSDQDSQLKELYYLLSILGFLHLIVQYSLVSQKHSTLSLTTLYLTPYLRLTFLLFFCLGSIAICKAVLNK